MTDKAFGIDVSRYQGKINWDFISRHQPKVVFAGIRATVSWGYTDSWFQHNWEEAKRVGVLRMAYHVVFPGENATRQMDSFLRLVGLDTGELPLVLDVELDHGLSPSAISLNILRCAQIIESRTGRKPILYSRASWVNQFMAGASWLDQYDWWLAQYLSTPGEHPGPPNLPSGVKQWQIHQTTSHGSPIGVESLQMDYDRWNGDESNVRKYAGLEDIDPETLPLSEWASSMDAWARTQGYTGPKPQLF